ncbi:MAG: hypothetical protein IID40_02095 [Planctomycetes bacterium]|nr:hypothetical protein [Planctomycetota bacterium]
MAEQLTYEMPEYLSRRQAARRHERRVQIVALLLAAACLAGAAALVAPMNIIRTERQMVIDPDDVKGLPPLETLLAKTGTFRALAIDIAFIRLERLKEEGKLYELMQLASWICRLAPRFASVWQYHAWNQAYNISVTCYTPEERWHWVNNGIKLLRDEGIVYNPKSIGLYKDLAWIYWHKIGDFLDDHHWSYKRELAVEMERILGPPPVLQTEEAVVDAFRLIAEAEGKLKGLLENDQPVIELAAELAALGLEPDLTLLDFVARNLRDDLSVERYLKSVPSDEAPTPHDRTVALLSDPARSAPREALLAAVRADVLEHKYHMNLEFMLSLMEHYGPLDWRSPYTHCLYWASWGDITTRGQLNLDPNDSMNAARYIFFALDNMIQRGRIVLSPNFDQPNKSFLELLPDPRFIDHYHNTVIEVSALQFPDDPAVLRGEPAGNYRGGYFNMMSGAIQQLWFQGDTESVAKAEHYYKYLRDKNRNADGTPKKRYLMPLDEYVMADLRDAAVGFKTANMLIAMLEYRSLSQLALGNTTASNQVHEIARRCYKYYMSDKWDDRQGRRKLGKLVVLRADATLGLLGNLAIPMTHKTRVWRDLELTTRQIIWDRAEPAFHAMCERHDPPLEVTKAFPEPPGMDAYRPNPIEDNRVGEEGGSEGNKQ